MRPRYEPHDFAALRERLLAAGTAPRHVRRYLRELEEHFDDLKAMQEERGYFGEDRDARARALLGDDEELAEAMLTQRRFRSLAARAPWLVFGLLPPLGIALLFLVIGLGMAAVGAPLHGPQQPLPDWCAPVADFLCRFANYAVGPATIALLLVTAWRQRLCGLWPHIGIVVAMVFGTVTTLAVVLPHHDSKGAVSVMMGLAFPAILQSTRFLTSAVIAGFSLWLSLRLQRRSFA